MKRFTKSALLALALFGLTGVSAVAQQIEGGALIGKLVSNNYFGEYHGTLKGSFPLHFFEMTVFPNGYVQGGFGPDRDYDDSTEWGGRVDKNGLLQSVFSHDGKDYTMVGLIDKRTRAATFIVKRRGKTVGTVNAMPERTEDYAARVSRHNAYLVIDDDNGARYNVSLSSDGTFELSGDNSDSGSYSIVRLGRDRAQIVLSGGGGTQTLIVYFMDADDSYEGIVYDAGRGKFYNWYDNY